MSEAFWSCRGSLSRSSTQLDSDQDFYSDESEEPHEVKHRIESCSQILYNIIISKEKGFDMIGKFGNIRNFSPDSWVQSKNYILSQDEYTIRSVCEHCGSAGKDHSFAEEDKCNWRETSLNSSLPIPKSQKWIQLD